jgi:CheY-like chemotaxis protein
MESAPEIELLLVDPDAEFRQTMGELLKEAGYTVAAAETEEHAERLLSRLDRSPLILLNDCYSHTPLEKPDVTQPDSSSPPVVYSKPVDLRELLQGIREQLPEHC